MSFTISPSKIRGLCPLICKTLSFAGYYMPAMNENDCQSESELPQGPEVSGIRVILLSEGNCLASFDPLSPMKRAPTT